MGTLRHLSRDVAKKKMKKAGSVRFCKHKNGHRDDPSNGSVFSEKWADIVHYKKHKRTISNRKKHLHLKLRREKEGSEL